MSEGPLLLNSITDADETARGRIAITGSHGGLYAAYLASKSDLRACIFNDAGIGLDDAGIQGAMSLGNVGMAAATVDCMTARMGDAADMLARGIVSGVNGPAATLGITTGMTCRQASALLTAARTPEATMPPVREARTVIPRNDGPDIVLVDSASLVTPDDAGKIIITGSHGGLIGGDPARAIKAPAALAVFNDAAVGMDDAGVSRLPALDQRGIAAVTVAHTSARIGDAASVYQTGVISRTNQAANALGAAPGVSLIEWIKSVNKGPETFD